MTDEQKRRAFALAMANHDKTSRADPAVSYSRIFRDLLLDLLEDRDRIYKKFAGELKRGPGPSIPGPPEDSDA